MSCDSQKRKITGLNCSAWWKCIYRVKQADHNTRGGKGGGGHMRWCLKLKKTDSNPLAGLLFSMKRSRCRTLKVKGRLTPTAPWGTRMVRVGRGQGSLCWSRWARWLDAADRGSEAGRWREGRLERAETRGRVPCYRRVGSTWFQPDSAPPDAFQSPAGSKHTWQRSECCSLWRPALQPPYGAHGGLGVIKSAAHQRIVFKMLLNTHIRVIGAQSGSLLLQWMCLWALGASLGALFLQQSSQWCSESPQGILWNTQPHSNINILVFEHHKLSGPKALMANWSTFGCITWMRLPNSNDPFSKPVVWYPWLPTNQSDNYLPQRKLFSTWEDRKPGWNAALEDWVSPSVL